MTFFIFWILLSILVGVFASSKKRSGVGWFFISLFISPLISFIILLVIGPSPSTLKKCPKCAEEVKVEAVVCRFCGYEFPKEENQKQSPELSPAVCPEKWKGVPGMDHLRRNLSVTEKQ